MLNRFYEFTFFQQPTFSPTHCMGLGLLRISSGACSQASRHHRHLLGIGVFMDLSRVALVLTLTNQLVRW